MISTHVRLRLGLCWLLLAGAGGCARIETAMYNRAADQIARGDRQDWLSDGGLHVILCGTGTPIADADRAGACTAVIAGGHLFLFDTGPGSWEKVQLWQLPRAKLSGVWLTHFHSDHIGDLGETIVQSWVAGRTEPLYVFGPPGVEDVVSGFATAYAFDAVYRNVHHGAAAMPLEGSKALARTITLPSPDHAALAYDRDGVRITAFAVDHEPVAPAFGYRVEYNGRSVVISGDTKKSANLIRHAKGADILVHEALGAHLIARISGILKERKIDRLAKLTSDILDYHTTPVEAAETAKEAEVKLLLLTHLVPPPPNRIVRRLFLQGVSDAWSGEVVLGEDGMHFTLPGGSGEITQAQLD